MLSQHHSSSDLSFTTIPYDIEECSSYSETYAPENIKDNKPEDLKSRWFCRRNNKQQHIVLKLRQTAIVYSITFGKFQHENMTNVREFKVLGGPSLNNMSVLLHKRLNNDNQKETFSLKIKVNHQLLPINYLKIVPLTTWGGLDFSIWYVELCGILEPAVVNNVLHEYETLKRTEAIRLCLKFLRQEGLSSVFTSLVKSTQVQLEDPLVEDLYRTLVLEGNFEKSEEILERAKSLGWFNHYISRLSYVASWKRLDSGNYVKPSPRGGHQMCLDEDNQVIYLFGGWNGNQDLADFWKFDIASNTWTLLMADASKFGGPTARSCHRICFDPIGRQIYVLGYYVDPNKVTVRELIPDFYVYDIDKDVWKLLSLITEGDGPGALYDHQMVIAPSSRLIFVFGGRHVFQQSSMRFTYGGFYMYDIEAGIWIRLRGDNDPPLDKNDVRISSRSGHSMLYDHIRHCIYIMAGQREQEYFGDAYVYDISTNRFKQISTDVSLTLGPNAGYSQKATIDPEHGEIYFFGGLIESQPYALPSNLLWLYDLVDERWSFVDSEGDGILFQPNRKTNLTKSDVPQSRFAHQFLYSASLNKHYLFGGNPGDQENMQIRLDDFWELSLEKPTPKEILRQCKFIVRKQQFIGICSTGDSMRALNFLRTKITETLDLNSTFSYTAFQELSAKIFQPAFPDNMAINQQQDRAVIFDQLISLFPPEFRQPNANLTEFLPNE